MKKILAVVLIGLVVLVGFGNIVISDSEERDFSNRAPSAPVFIYEKCSLEKNCYSYCLFSEDPDGDNIYYQVTWEKIDNPKMVMCSSDDPVIQLFGPYTSGEEFEQDHIFTSSGTYKLSIRARDIYDNIGPASSMTVTYTESNLLQLPIFSFIKNNFPEVFDFLSNIF